MKQFRFLIPAVIAGLMLSLFVSCPGWAQSNLEKALRYTPKHPGVDIDTPTSAELPKCEIKQLTTADNKTGWVVYDSRNQIIRQFIDQNGDKVLDQMSYFKSGVEVYRDIDSDYNRTFDQHRWLGTGGRRWGIDRNQDGKIDIWKSISAEEVSLEVVESIRTFSGDTSRFNALVISNKEIEQLGLSKSQTQEVQRRAENARKEFANFVRTQRMIKRESNWIHFSGLLPGIIPEGTNGSKKDVLIYDNVAAVINDGGRSSSQLSIGTLIKVGDSWKVIDLPEPIVEGQALTNGGLFFQNNLANQLVDNNNEDDDTDVISEADQKLYEELTNLEKQISSLQNKGRLNTSEQQQIQTLNAKRAEMLRRQVDTAKTSENKSIFVRQLADTITGAYQQGFYDGGIRFMQDYVKKLETMKDVDRSAIVHCTYRVITSFYSREIDKATTEEFPEIQKNYMDRLERFVKANPKDENSSDAMLQLALDDEGNGEIKKAKEWYGRIVRDFPNSTLYKRANGASIRLNSEGKVIPFEGKTLDGRTFRLSDRKGKVVLLHYWATWSEPSKTDFKAIKEAYNEYSRRGFEVVSVSLDYNVNELKNYLRQNQMPWTHLYAEGDLDSPLSEQLGVAMVPTMILVGADGRVIDRNLIAQDIDRLLSRQFNRSAQRGNKK